MKYLKEYEGFFYYGLKDKKNSINLSPFTVQ